MKRETTNFNLLSLNNSKTRLFYLRYKVCKLKCTHRYKSITMYTDSLLYGLATFLRNLAAKQKAV